MSLRYNHGMTTNSSQSGKALGYIITIVFLAIFMITFAGLAVWAYMNYDDQKTNVDAKIDRAVAVAEKEQADDLEAKFLEREKQPNRAFAGPSDYGTLGFMYPKTWSVYVAADGVDSDEYEAYLNPITVPPVEDETRIALRVTISNTRYEEVIAEFEGLVEEGELTSSPVKIDGEAATRLDGKFTEDIRGSAVVFKIRDKTATVRTDADTFKKDYEALIKTITFIK